MISAKNKIVPAQRKGGQSATRHAVYEKNIPAAKTHFARAKANLFDVNNWQKLTDGSGAAFQVYNPGGERVNDDVAEGNFLQISIPLIDGVREGDGYDWVKVEKVESGATGDYEWAAVRVKPRPVPFLLADAPPHFFSDKATSSFIVERRGTKLTAAVYGRNEVPNTALPQLFSKIRNAIVGFAAIIGFNKPQWKGLVKGLLEK